MTDCHFYLSLPVIVLADFIFSFYEKKHKNIIGRLSEDEKLSSLIVLYWVDFPKECNLLWVSDPAQWLSKWLMKLVHGNLCRLGSLGFWASGWCKTLWMWLGKIPSQSKIRILTKCIPSNISQKSSRTHWLLKWSDWIILW